MRSAPLRVVGPGFKIDRSHHKPSRKLAWIGAAMVAGSVALFVWWFV